MQRSGSTSRFSDISSYYSSSPATALRTLMDGDGRDDKLPVYEPQSEVAKKDRAKSKFSENAVHIIPLVLLLCCIILWLFSNPDVDVSGRSMAAKVQAITIDGDLESDGTGHSVGIGDLDVVSKTGVFRR